MDVAEQYNLAYNLWLEANGNKRYYSERGSGREITRGEFARLIVLKGIEAINNECRKEIK